MTRRVFPRAEKFPRTEEPAERRSGPLGKRFRPALPPTAAGRTGTTNCRLIEKRGGFMITRVKKIDADSLAEAREIILSGGVVAFPTETVYGLAETPSTTGR